MKKLESVMEENRRYLSNLEKENKELEDKLTTVNTKYLNHISFNFLVEI